MGLAHFLFTRCLFAAGDFNKGSLMKKATQHILLASMLACAGLSVQAQTPTDAPKGPPPAGHEHRGGPGGKFDPARMQEFQARRLADLKAKLKLTPAQEGAWTSFTADLQPPAASPCLDRSEMDKLTTPQRLDKMREMRTAHAAFADKRDASIRSFYATLSAEQQKTFDTEFRHGGPGPRGGHGGRGHGHGPRHGGPRGDAPRAPAN
jgi:hypothetical protein